MHHKTLSCLSSRYLDRNVILPIRRVTSTALDGLFVRVLSRESSALCFGVRSLSRVSMRYSSAPMFLTIPLLTSHRCTASFSSKPYSGSGKSGGDGEFTSGPSSSGPENPTMLESEIRIDYEFDPMASMQNDVLKDTARKNFDRVLYALLPADPPTSAVEKVRHYLQQHPIDILITQPRVQITHRENAETGLEEKVSLAPVALSEALQEAKQRGVNLVQMSARDDLAFCRIRTEQHRILKLIEPDLQEYETARSHVGEPGRESKAKKLIEHTFRDAVDAHFIGWKSRKICEDLQKGHPARITIKDFQSPEMAMQKLREMCAAIQSHAEANAIYHHVTSVVGNERGVNVSLSPALPTKTVRHPTAKDWANALKRMEESCRCTGRLGTYIKDNRLRPRNIGMSMFRVDKYGRRVD
ncbi:unnamed protein product [Phytomonas sp. Hart1]|nr:unnamed protein product [Phytomonas sp. Hart1]|eukprot:CCW70181.1 unnamed protein product [Phytomonas sp. isolate Hart1]